MTDEQKKTTLDWRRKIHQLEYANRYQSIFWSNLHIMMGLSAFILSLVIAFSFRFPKVSKEEYDSLCWICRHENFLALGSLIVAMLTGLNTFLKPNERAALHRTKSDNYERLRRDFERLAIKEHRSKANFESSLDGLQEKYNNMDVLNTFECYYAKARNEVKTNQTYSELF